MKVSRKFWVVLGYGAITILIASIFTHSAVGSLLGICALIISFIGLERQTFVQTDVVQQNIEHPKTHNKTLEPEESVLH